jgi:endonuclease YncB( thermonuclease family)
MNSIRRIWWLFGLLAVLAGPLLAAELTGKVVGVADGDTLTLLVPDGASFKQVRIRLAEIDTPESRQPYGQRAKQALSDLAFNQQARVRGAGYRPLRPHERAGVRGRRGRERGTGEAGRGVGVGV